MLLALLACTDGGFGGRIATYEISLVVRYPKNQDPVEDADSLELVLDHAEGDPEVFELSLVDKPQLDGLGDLDNTRILLRALAGDELLAYGVTTPLTAHNESIEQTLLVAEVDSMAWLESGQEGRGSGALVADGLGSFLLFGGESENPGDFDAGGPGWDSETHSSIWRLDVAPPDSLAFETIDTSMPNYEGSADGQDYGGRSGHTATLLTGNADDAGYILVAGGSAGGASWHTSTYHAFLFDPSSEEVIDIGDDPLRAARYGHVAVEHVSGDVFLMGGWGRAPEGSIGVSTGWEIYRRDSRSFENGDGQLPGTAYGAAASLGTDGVLFCGGISVTTKISSEDGCLLLQPSGSSEHVSSPGDLAFSHHAMVPLGNGRVLLAGGIRAELLQYEVTDALDEAWIYDASSGQWSQTGDLNIPRANHAMVPLPDGRILVLGGSTSTHAQSSESPVACAEIFDPDQGSFELLDGCTDSSTSGTLPTAVFWPMVAVDEDYGVLVAGGYNAQESADPNASLWLPKPAE